MILTWLEAELLEKEAENQPCRATINSLNKKIVIVCSNLHRLNSNTNTFCIVQPDCSHNFDKLF